MYTTTQPLARKVALVTGGSRGIGAAIVRRLASDGADVAFSYATSEHEAELLLREVHAIGRKAISVKADQAVVADVENLVWKVHDKFGRLDILVNSAGIFVPGVVGDLTVDLKALDRQLAVNVKGVVATVRTAVPLMSDGGRIVSIGATSAVHFPFNGVSDYIATKAAIAAYTRAWSRDLGARNITVNIIQPGAINTEMNSEGQPYAEALNKLASLGRHGKPEDVASAVSFLVGPEAGYITGATLNVDGGQAA
ncbi:SDR family oxidoreductase [Paraburkholderia strydomiana]|uniref:SDR family oxidoreductase n=1 Tax=Paraburkholderia strydomiana TaxID=1245417 RepID=UPI0038B96579